MRARTAQSVLFEVEPEIAQAVREVIAVLRRKLTDDRPRRLTQGKFEFHRQGSVWLVAFNGEPQLVRHLIGMEYIASLLRRPEIPVSVGELERLTQPGRVIEVTTLRADPISDRHAVAEFRRRSRELRTEIAAALDRGDAERHAILSEELEAITAHLRTLSGLAGRPREFVDEAERLRNRVSRAIWRAVDEIQSASPKLDQHLRRSIKTGQSCVYAPKNEIAWKL